MLKYLSSPEQSRFAELQHKLAQFSITAEEQQELSTLVTKAQHFAGERAKAIETARKLIADNAIEIQAVFSAQAILGAAASLNGKRAKAVNVGGKTRHSSSVGRSEQVLIQVKLDKGAGAPSRYKKGQKLAKFVSRNFKALDVGNQLSENLLKYATPLGQAYFSTPEGKAELEAFARHVHLTPVNS